MNARKARDERKRRDPGDLSQACTFCMAPSVEADTEPTTLLAMRADGLLYGSSGYLRACSTCAALLDANDEAGLVKRARQAFRRHWPKGAPRCPASFEIASVLMCIRTYQKVRVPRMMRLWEE